MKIVVIDIECNGLIKPTKIWVIVCKDIKTGETHVFREPSSDQEAKEAFIRYAEGVDYWIGHNICGYDAPVLLNLIGPGSYNDYSKVIDTLVVSKIFDYSRKGHSLEDYGLEFGIEKELFNDFTKYSFELERRCLVDVNINHKVYNKYIKDIYSNIDNDYIKDKGRKASNSTINVSIMYEQEFIKVCEGIKDNGFYFNIRKAKELLIDIQEQLSILDKDILSAFPPRLKLIREITPKSTIHGTISLSSIPRSLRSDISDFSIGASFCYCHWQDFNPSSHKQIIDILNQAGWKPTDRTKSHIEAVRLRQEDKLVSLRKSGWRVNENNLETLPPSAPKSARLLAKRIMLESRRRTLVEWIDLVQEDQRLHPKFIGIGAWTHRMAHQNPNCANIPNEFDTQGKKKLYGKELRALWCAPRNRLLVGVDAEGIQLRIFAHYIDDPEFTEALVNGRKEAKTDPHSLNQRILGAVCKSRQSAKRYIYALLLGAGRGKLQEILDCDERSAAEAYDRLLSRYTGFAHLKETIIPRDAKRGWFTGLDGRRVRIPGDTDGSRRHLAMSGYLQNGEAVVMKLATLRFLPLLPEGCFLVNFVHDEWQTEVPNDMKIALQVASHMADSLRIIGERLKLKCPLAGSYWNDDLKDYTIATNWAKTH